jgi:hypothetical protein
MKRLSLIVSLAVLLSGLATAPIASSLPGTIRVAADSTSLGNLS